MVHPLSMVYKNIGQFQVEHFAKKATPPPPDHPFRPVASVVSTRISILLEHTT